MNTFRIAPHATLIVLATMSAMIGLNPGATAQQTTTGDAGGMELLTRGPIHEAFAGTIVFDPEPGIVTPNAPPDPVEEIAPDQRPEGANVSWIPGYWGWDDERGDFVWVSGIWRALPPGRQWVPGYWAKAQQGYQWTSGYWADATASEIDYLPEPPASIETGPNIAAPSADDTWLPGSWVWQQNRYGWRPGYWTKGNQDWDWVPDHYVWTPRGYVFVDGYYDYSVPRRGVAFAPVYFSHGLRTQRGFTYSPSRVINSSVFGSDLFLRPNYGHYYFGDYSGSNYENAGYAPWFSYQSSRRGYDPIYANQRWQHRRDRNWEQQNQQNFRDFRNNEDSRPSRNWPANQDPTRRGEFANRRGFDVTVPLNEFSQRKDAQLRFQQVDPTERQKFDQSRTAYRDYLRQRQQLEANDTRDPSDNSLNTPSRRSQFSRSPFVAQPADQLGRDFAPPQRRQVMKPDFQVQPQPRTRGARPNQDWSQSQPQFQGRSQGDRRGAGQQQNPQRVERQRNRQTATGGQQPSQRAGGGNEQSGPAQASPPVPAGSPPANTPNN